MIFSSPEFLFGFLPIVLLSLLALRSRNIIILLFSLAFYFYGEGVYTLVLIVSFVLNYIFGIIIQSSENKRKDTYLKIGVAINLLILVYYKYLGFLVDAISEIIGAEALDFSEVHLPLGVSFFTFQGISYLIDIKRGDVKANNRLDHVALYITSFPQLVAGPIVRYVDVVNDIMKPRLSWHQFFKGVERFSIGLFKKVVIADTLGVVVDLVFIEGSGYRSSPAIMLGTVCFAAQIYFDFSGYSDMAIGLGRMFGFKFPENFKHPYSSKSIQEFWRRWHISLSSFFRDYLYIPLGGNRKGAFRTYVNLLIVFILCGLWHGASWTFVIWGLYHGIWLSIERTSFGEFLRKLPSPLQYTYAFVVAVVGWIPFRAESTSDMQLLFIQLFDLSTWAQGFSEIAHMMDGYRFFILGLAIIFFVPTRRKLLSLTLYATKKINFKSVSDRNTFYFVIKSSAYMIATAVALVVMSSQTYQAFIYFRF